jgi:hypothetical protein
MATITHEETFAARDVMPPVEVCTTKTKTGEEIYLLWINGSGIDHEMSREEAEGLRDALSMALQTHQ